MTESVHQTREDKPPITVETADGTREAGEAEATPVSHTFQDMAKDYEFFTPALVVLPHVGGFDRDPVAEFCRFHPCEEEGSPFAIDYQAEALFSGLGTSMLPDALRGQVEIDWDRRVYAIVRERWLLCRDFIAGIAFTNPAKKIYTRLNFYEMSVLDPIAARRGGVLMRVPMFPITVFGVSSTHHFSYLAEPFGPVGRPYLRQDPPEEALQVEGFAVLGPPPNPDALRAKSKLRGDEDATHG